MRVQNILKFTIQAEKRFIFIFKYCKNAAESDATLILAATLIIMPTVQQGFSACVVKEKTSYLGW
jgi:hypothetical protein